ncbi:MAG: phospholipase D-like domain-containing protein, partial [Rhodoferax sp.]|nr:phospholipase D-like domain-containing protein [Rhodoferax sp.]
MAARALAASTRNDSGFALVGSAELAFTSRMTLIKAAEKTLDLQSYAIHADDTTDRLFEALRQAAGRGVRVRILLDDFNTAGKNAQVLQLAFEKNIEMRLFNPLPSNRSSAFWRIISSLSDAARLQRRMHNKIFVADNALSITGGRNLGDAYFGQSEGVNFVDIEVLGAGRIARDLSRSFDQYWNNPLAFPVQALMTRSDIEALKLKPPASIASSAGDSFSVATSIPGPNDPNTPNRTSVSRVAVSPEGLTSTIAALPDTTDLRLLSWT